MTTKITVNKPGYPHSGQAFRISGALSGYAYTPKLSYADDPPHPGKVSGITGSTSGGTVALHWSPPTTGAVYIPFPYNSGVTRTAFHFQHPGLSPGHHTVYVTDGNAECSVGFGVSNAAHMRRGLLRLRLPWRR